MTQFTDVDANLLHPDASVRLQAVRTLKNMIIGSRSKKEKMFERQVADKLAALVQNDEDERIVTQSIIVCGSLGLGSEDRCALLLPKGVVHAIIGRFPSLKSARSIEAALRSLRILLGYPSSQKELLATHPQFFSLLVSLLRSAAAGTTTVTASTVVQEACSLISCVGDSEVCRQVLLEAGVLQDLLTMSCKPNQRLRENALDALSSLSAHSTVVCSTIASAPVALDSLISITLDRDVSTARAKFLAIRVLVHLHRASVLTQARGRVDDAERIILPALLKLISSDDAFRDDAVLLFAQLVQGDVRMQEAASEADTIARLSEFVVARESSPRLKRHSLLAIAALCSSLQEARVQVAESKLLVRIVDFLRGAHGSDAAMRVAACECIRSLSRSVRHLRTALVDAGVANPLFALLNDSDREVRSSAAAALCNLVVEASPMKVSLVEQGVISRFVAMIRQPETPQMRWNGLSGIANILYAATPAIRNDVCVQLPVSELVELVCDPQFGIQQKALLALRNLLVGEGVPSVLSQLEPQFLQVLSERIASPVPTVASQALFVAGNLAAEGNVTWLVPLLSEDMLARIGQSLFSTDNQVALAALWFVMNVVWDSQQPDKCWKVQTLSSYPTIVNGLRSLQESSILELKDRASSALSIIKNVEQTV
jgi:hypothetical protein